MPLTVQRDGQAPAIVPVEDVMQMLPSDVPAHRLLRDVIVDQTDVTFFLRDGTRVVVSAPSAQRARQHNPQLALPAPLRPVDLRPRRFSVHCDLWFRLPATIEVKASHRGGAETLVKAAFSGPPPVDVLGLRVRVAEHDIADVTHRIEGALRHGQPAELHPDNITINRTEEHEDAP